MRVIPKHSKVNNCRKGIHFYKSLMGLVDPAVERVNKFIKERRAEGGTLLKSIQVEKPNREQERLREDLSRLTLSYGTTPPPPVPPVPPTRTPSMPIIGNYQYSSQ